MRLFFVNDFTILNSAYFTTIFHTKFSPYNTVEFTLGIYNYFKFYSFISAFVLRRELRSKVTMGALSAC